MKQLVHYFIALTCALLLLPLTARAQGGLITDTDGSVTGTSGKQYLWVNAANFPDEGFRFAMQKYSQQTAGGQKYIIPADITNIDLSEPCCNYYQDKTIYYTRPTRINFDLNLIPQQYRAEVEAFISAEAYNSILSRLLAEGYNHIYSVRAMNKYTHTYVSSFETINGMHKVTISTDDYIRITMGYDYDIYDYGEIEDWEGLYEMDVPLLVSSSQVLSHSYYPTEYHDVSDLTGINYFTNVHRLNCNNQQLKGTLDLRALTKLDSLDCSNNRLTNLKVNLHAYPIRERRWKELDNKRGIAHQRVFLDCSNNYLSDLNDVNVIRTAEGQLVNVEGSYANNRILAYPLGNHPYFDKGYDIFAYADWATFKTIRLNRNGLTNNQKVIFERLATPDTQTSGYYINLNFHNGAEFYDYNAPNMLKESSQNLGVNLSIIDKTRRRVGVKVADNLYDEPDRFRNVFLLNEKSVYPDKVKSGENTYYEFPVSDSAHDLDYCHTTPSGTGYLLLNSYQATVNDYIPSTGHPSPLTYGYNDLWLTKYADIFDPNKNPAFLEPDEGLLEEIGVVGDIAIRDPGEQNIILRATQHRVTLTADHYVMYVNPLSEDKDGKCNGTVILDYDAVIPAGVEAFIVTSYTDGGESDRFKTGRLNLVKVGDGDGADGYKRVIPANNPVLLRTKQTVSEGQAADKMSTTGLYPFHRNNDRTLYPCPDPNDAQYDPLEKIPASMFADNKLRGVLNLYGQSYAEGEVLTLGRFMDNNEKKIGFWTYNGSKLNMHRVYILKSDLNMSSNAKGATLGFGDDAVTTGIGGVTADSHPQDNVWYTLQGVRLSAQPTQAGVYIYNGKKVLVQEETTLAPTTRTSAPVTYPDNF